VSDGPTGGYTNWTDVTVAFTDTRGIPVHATHEGADSTQVGDRFRIVYDPADPTNLRWDTSTDEAQLRWSYAALDLAASVLLVACALWVTFRRRRATRAQPPA
jgi:hypothetical protein